MARVTRASTASSRQTHSAVMKHSIEETPEKPATKRRKTVKKAEASPRKPKTESPETAVLSSTLPSAQISDKKWNKWTKHAAASPFPDFPEPTPEACQRAYNILEEMHGEVVRANFAEEGGPMADLSYPIVMNALVVAALSQATSWANAKRAMASMEDVYGSTFAYDRIQEGGIEKLQAALRPGGMQNRKAKILMALLRDVKARHGGWDLQHLFDASDEEVMKEVVSYWGVGPKSAYCLMSICLKRDRFAVDTHIYRLAGLWGWRPADARVELTQAHLNIRIPHDIKFALHYQMIIHGRECPCCRGGQGGTHGDLRKCEFWKRFKATSVKKEKPQE
ncbi:base excision DNA repair protein [Plectosphaerella cucumerina]|uniref:Base excision DNA repair protein n=1 Tax=Plectosphaerella cucumerina TaxID=40658 RepID=A0A8K0T5K7_9PEZI|nr:base excision DNA repair protein [Plectosphaerella cucumerina]